MLLMYILDTRDGEESCRFSHSLFSNVCGVTECADGTFITCYIPLQRKNLGFIDMCSSWKTLANYYLSSHCEYLL